MFEIIIKNLKLYGYHGVNPEEKINGQEFLFNVWIMLKKHSFMSGNKTAGITNDKNISHNTYEDEISATVNYSEVISLIKDINSRKKYNLLETLCEELSLNILKNFPMVLKVKVAVEKISPPINEDIESVGVKYFAEADEFPTGGPYGKTWHLQQDILANAKDSIVFYLSLGSNLADREENLKNAVKRLADRIFINVIKVSSIYESEPMYVKKQDNFYNIVLKGEILSGPGTGHSEYNAFEFLGLLKSIEHSMGRKAFSQRYGPRIIDLDLLYFDDKEIISDLLILPHPGIIERKFVLVPLNEIEPGFVVNGKKIADLIGAVSAGEKVFKIKKW